MDEVGHVDVHLIELAAETVVIFFDVFTEPIHKCRIWPKCNVARA